MTGARGVLRALHVCYASLEDPLIQTQVVAYLEGLAARGHTIHLLTYEPSQDRERIRALRVDLARRGIVWHRLRYHKRPSLPATALDALAGAVVGSWLVRRHRLDAVHARSHVPAATGLLVRRLAGCGLVFDIRGLMGEEYVDAGRWPRDGIAHRLTTRVQRAAIGRADGIVVLTERVRRHLFGDDARRATVIPCCADLERLTAPAGEVEALRRDLGLEGRRVMVYVGKLSPPYMEREMAAFFAAARRADPALAFLILTQAPPGPIVDALAGAGISPDDHRITQAPPERLGAHLGLAEFAISFCRPSPARIASSPTKLGEYLAAGLPVVSGPDIGDMDAILGGARAGVIVDAFDDAGYARALERLRVLTADAATPQRCRQVARDVFSLRDVGVPRYDALYREVARRRA